MTTPLFLLKVLLFWIGFGATFAALWRLGRTQNALSASAVAVGGLLGSTLLPSLPGSTDSVVWRIPLALPIVPTEYVLAVPCLIYGAVLAIRSVLTSTADKRRALAIASVALLAIGAFSVHVAGGSPTKLELRTASIGVSVAKTLLFFAAAALGTVATAWATRFARGMALVKGIGRYFGLTVGAIAFGLPLLWMVSTSLREDAEINAGKGVRWIPSVDLEERYNDPLQPVYRWQSAGQSLEGVIDRKNSDGTAVMDIRRPLSMVGRTDSASFASLVLIPELKPVVMVGQGAAATRALDLEDLPDGRHRVHFFDGWPDGIVESGSMTPVRQVGARWENYPEALEYLPPETDWGLVFLRNTGIILILSVIGAVASGAIVAYAFARLTFPGKKFLFILLLSTMMLPSAVTLLPQFLIFRSLGWVDTLKPLWVPAFFGNAFNVFMLRQFFARVPNDLEEAAKLDGCSVPRTFWSVAVPQIYPALATIAIWTAVGAWNNFTGPLIYINSPENMPVSYAVQLYQGQQSSAPGLQMAFVTMSVIPVIALFLFAQRYFVDGLTATVSRPASTK